MSRTKKSIRKELENIDDLPFDTSTQIQLHKELFWEGTSSTRILYSTTDHIDFRLVEWGKVSEPFVLTLYNSSSERMKVKWIIDKDTKSSSSNKIKSVTLSNFNKIQKKSNLVIPPSMQSNNFYVVPEEFTINKKSSAEFKVYFKPIKPESYFFTTITCLGTLLTNYDNVNAGNVEKNKLGDTKQGFNISKNQKVSQETQTLSSYQSNLLKSLQTSEKAFELFDPPIPLKISAVGHSFPPQTQISIPMSEIHPSDKLQFHPTSLNQSIYECFSIKNNSDTPLYFKCMTDISNVFRIHPKCGLVSPKSKNLVCVEFCPKEEISYEFGLNIIFNHDSRNMKKLVLSGLCVSPYLRIEEGDTIYFPPSYIGINTKKILTLVNISPIRVNVQVNVITNLKASVVVEPGNYFDLESNQIKKIDIYLKLLELGEVISKIVFVVNRIYDPVGENIGIYNPGSHMLKQTEMFDRRTYEKST